MIENQLSIFFIYFICGIIMCIFFDFFRSLRKSFKTNNLATHFEDIIYWIVVLVFIIFISNKYNNGELRMYNIISIFISAALYFSTISIFMNKIIYNIIVIIKTIIKKIIMFVIRLFRVFIGKPVYFCYINIKKAIYNILKK